MGPAVYPMRYLREWLNMVCGRSSKEAVYAYFYGASLSKVGEQPQAA